MRKQIIALLVLSLSALACSVVTPTPQPLHAASPVPVAAHSTVTPPARQIMSARLLVHFPEISGTPSPSLKITAQARLWDVPVTAHPGEYVTEGWAR